MIAALTSPESIRAYLGDLLSEVLGTWKDGTPAIYVGNPPSRLAPATGCQCIIDAVPVGPTYNTSGNMRFLDRYWRCRLVNIVPADSQQSLSTAANWLSRSPHVRGITHIPATSTTAEQISFEIYAPGFVSRL